MAADVLQTTEFAPRLLRDFVPEQALKLLDKEELTRVLNDYVKTKEGETNFRRLRDDVVASMGREFNRVITGQSSTGAETAKWLTEGVLNGLIPEVSRSKVSRDFLQSAGAKIEADQEVTMSLAAFNGGLRKYLVENLQHRLKVA